MSISLTRDDVITKFNGVYTGSPTSEFISKRNEKISTTRDKSELNKYRRWDSEFPENDIVNHMKSLEIYEKHDHDIDCPESGKIDFKLFASYGVKVNTYPVKQVGLGNIDYFLIWKWTEAWSEPLVEHMDYSYEILGMVDAKKAINALFHSNKHLPHFEPEYRFHFPLL